MKSNKSITIILGIVEMVRGSIVALGKDEALYTVAHIENGFVFIYKLRNPKKPIKVPINSVRLLIL